MSRSLIILFLIVAATAVFAQTATRSPTPPTLGLESGLASFDTPEFSIKLVNASQALAALEPKPGTGFDFTPADRLNVRASDGFYQFGDINFRVRVGNGEWQSFSTASNRKPVIALPVNAPDLAQAD